MKRLMTIEERILGKPSLEGEHKTKRRKCIKKMNELVSISLGCKNMLNNVMELEEKVVAHSSLSMKEYVLYMFTRLYEIKF
jgi:hypothetical protein